MAEPRCSQAFTVWQEAYPVQEEEDKLQQLCPYSGRDSSSGSL